MIQSYYIFSSIGKNLLLPTQISDVGQLNFDYNIYLLENQKPQQINMNQELNQLSNEYEYIANDVRIPFSEDDYPQIFNIKNLSISEKENVEDDKPTFEADYSQYVEKCSYNEGLKYFEEQHQLEKNPTQSPATFKFEIKSIEPSSAHTSNAKTKKLNNLETSSPTKKIKKTLNKKHKKSKKVSSQTKNISKNYGKQIIKFIQKNQELVTKVLVDHHIFYKQFVAKLKIDKKKMNKMSDLRHLWTDHQYAKVLRIITEHFLRKHCFHWIFNSRIENIKFPMKYRHRIIEGVRKPFQFEYLKEY